MIRAIVWKEFREQGLIGLTLIVLGSGVLVAVASQAAPPVEGAPPSDVIRFLGLGRLATLMLAVTAGMVCGGAVFAAEREAGTMSFLESLPTTHARLWRAKLVAGFALTLIQAAVLLAVATGLDLVPRPEWALGTTIYALLAFVWGMFGSTAARTTLGSVGIAIPAAVLCAVCVGIPVILLFQTPGSGLPRSSGLIVYLAGMFLVPLFASSWLFTRSDRERIDIKTRATRTAVPAMLWLTGRQFLLPGLVIAGFALVAGLSLLVPDPQPFLVWPFLALTAGSLCGTLTFADEQVHGSNRFWAEQRLPLGRLWTVKLVAQLLYCFALLVLMAIPATVRAQFFQSEVHGMIYSHATLSSVFGTQLFDELRGQGWNYLFLPAVYGFAAGHLSGLVFRKFVVAWAVAGLVGGVAALLWLPSLLAGGTRFWQLWLPPVLVLATARLATRAWTADRLLSRRPLGGLALGTLAAFLALAAGIAYRVLEIPNYDHGEDDIAYLAQLPPFEENAGGRDFKHAGELYASAVAPVSAIFNRPTATPPPPLSSSGQRTLLVEERLDTVPYRGWPEHDANLAVWLDKVFAPTKPAKPDDVSWQALVQTAATRPLGIYEHPQMLTASGVAGTSLEYARRMSVALLVRGLQFQSRGDSDEFIHHFTIALALARTMRNGSVVSCLKMGNDIERLALHALDRWLEKVPPLTESDPAVSAPLAPAFAAVARDAVARHQFRQLQDLIAVLETVDPTTPFDPTPQFLAERHITREALKAPTQWLPQQLGIPQENQGLPDPIVDLLATAWAVPWEKERTRRLIGSGFESGSRVHEAAISGRPGRSYLVARHNAPGDLAAIDLVLRTNRRAAILKLALMAYRTRFGNFPAALGQLLDAAIVRRLPPDPYDDSRDFGYRISPGETLKTPPHTTNDRLMLLPRDDPADRDVLVPAGQAIIWSVGPDRIDQGGVNPPASFVSITSHPEDMVYLVPPLPR